MSDFAASTLTKVGSAAQESAEIRCEGVTRQFSKESKPAVDHVNLVVDAGSFVVLLGPSGSGKTTLLKMINRLYEPTAGKIFIGGVEVHELPVTQLRRKIGYVIQQVGLFPHMTIAQNIAVVPSLLGWERQRIDDRIDMLLDMVGLPLAYRSRHPRQLSGGEQQRVGLARALAADPETLLMDEPFAAIDAINRECLQDELIEIHHKVHKTVMFVTHDVEEAFRLADKIAVLRDGRLVQYASPLELVTQPKDDFVQELIGAENLVRRLSLIDVNSVLEARESWASDQAAARVQTGSPAIVRPEEDLRTALSRLLNTGADALQVVTDEGRQVGRISFTDLRAALARHASRPQERS